MSRENVEVATQAIDAFNGSDIDVFAALTTPDFEWSPSMAAIDGETYRGREGIEKYFGTLDNAWEKFHILRDGFRDLGDLVVMLGRLEGRGKGSGAPVNSPLGMVFDFRGGSDLADTWLSRSRRSPRGRGAVGVGTARNRPYAGATARWAKTPSDGDLRHPRDGPASGVAPSQSCAR